jgi:hypothetical protein
MDSLSDPATLFDDPDVDHQSESGTVPEEVFEDLANDTEGLVGVVVTRADGAVLLVEGPSGWALPYTDVEPGEDWVERGRIWLKQLTGVVVDVDGALRVREVEYHLADGDRSTLSHQVLLDGPTVEAERAADLTMGGSIDTEWFTEVPDDADGVEDIEFVLETAGAD